MPGVPGSGGSVPKRSSQRRRRNEPDIPIKTGEGILAEAPEADPSWHPIAREWYEALGRSGQSIYYQASDWATAYVLAESLSRDLKPRVIGIHPETGKAVRATIPISGSSLSAYLKGMTALVVTEGDRRRARIELSVPRPDAGQSEGGGNVAWLDDARRRATGSAD